MPKKKNKGKMKDDGAAATESGSSTANVSGSSTANISGVSTPEDNTAGGSATSVANVEASATSTTPDPAASTLLDLTTSTPPNPTTSTLLGPTSFTPLNPTIFTPIGLTTSSTDDPTITTPSDVVPTEKKKRDRSRRGKNRQTQILTGGQDASSSDISATVGSATVENDPNQGLTLQSSATHETFPPSSGFSFIFGRAKEEDDPSARLSVESSALNIALRESKDLKKKLAQLEETFEEAKRNWGETEMHFDQIAEDFEERIHDLDMEVDEEIEKTKEKTEELERSRITFEVMLRGKENEIKSLEEKCESEKKSMKNKQDKERATWNEITESSSAALKNQQEAFGSEKAALKGLVAKEEAENKLLKELITKAEADNKLLKELIAKEEADSKSLKELISKEEADSELLKQSIAKEEADSKLLKEALRRARLAKDKESDNSSALRKRFVDKEKKWKETYDKDLASAKEKSDESARKVVELEEALRKCHKDQEEAKKHAPDMDESASTTVLKKKIDELQAECHKYWGQLQQFQDDSRNDDDEIRKLKDEIAAKNTILSDLEVAVAKNEKVALAAKVALTEAQRSVADIEAERKESNRNFDDIIRNQELGKATIENQKAEIESLQLRIQQLEGEVAAKDQSMQRLVAELKGLDTQFDELVSARNQHDRQKPPDAPYSHLDPEDYDVPQETQEKREDRQKSSLGAELENLDVLSSSDDELERDAKIQDLLGQVSSLKNDLQAALAGAPELEASKVTIRHLESEAAAAQIRLKAYETRIQELEETLSSMKTEGRSYPSDEISNDGRIEELENEIVSLKATAEESRLKIDSLTTERDTLLTRVKSLQNKLLQQSGSNSEQPIVTVANFDPIAPSKLPSADSQPVRLVVQPVFTVANIAAISALEDPAFPGPVSLAINNGHNATVFNWAFNPFKAWWRVYLNVYVYFIRLLNICLPNDWQVNEPSPPTLHFYLRDAVQSQVNTTEEVHTMIVEPPNLMLPLLMFFCHGLIYYLIYNYVFDINYLRDERNLWLQANDLTRQMIVSFRSTGNLGFGIHWLDKLAFDLHVRSGFDRSFPG